MKMQKQAGTHEMKWGQGQTFISNYEEVGQNLLQYVIMFLGINAYYVSVTKRKLCDFVVTFEQ